MFFYIKMPTFNLSCYRQLVAKTDCLTSKNEDFFTDPIFLELLSLESSLQTQIFYNNKNNYFTLIQKYLDEIINPYVFRAKFIEMVNEDMKKSHKILNDFEELSTFWIDLKLDEFCSLFENIHETCFYAFEFEDEKNLVPEDKFCDSIQKIFFKIQKYLDKR